MTLQTSGAISLDDVATEFGGATPHAITEYYGADTGVPTSGQIALSDFHGTSSVTPVSFVASSSSLGDTLSIPSHNNYDLLLVSLINHDNSTVPSIPIGWTSLALYSGVRGHRVAYKFLGTSETSETFTNATTVVGALYRNVGGTAGIGNVTSDNDGGGTDPPYWPANTPNNPPALLVALGSSVPGDTISETSPPSVSGVTFVVREFYQPGAGTQSCNIAMDTNETVSSFAGKQDSAGNSSRYMTCIVELNPA